MLEEAGKKKSPFMNYSLADLALMYEMDVEGFYRGK